MKYEGTSHKIDKSFQQEVDNTNKAEGLNYLDLNSKSDHVLKVGRTIKLIQNYNSSHGIIDESYPFNESVEVISGGPGYYGGLFIFNVSLSNFPEWAIPFTKIIPKVHMEDGFNPEAYNGLQLVTNCRHLWQYIDGINWKLRVEITAYVLVSGVYLPLFLDVDLVIINERVWEEINSNKA